MAQAYVCPDCKVSLNAWTCPSCGENFSVSDDIPVLISNDPHLRSGIEIGRAYDDIYASHVGVWVEQGRTPEFIAYFSALLSRISRTRVLEIGCGEGFLLSSMDAAEKCAIDISLEALRKARERVDAEYCVALAERLPYPGESFDVVTSVGVMEHFVDDRLATREIHRVLRYGGQYVVLIHVAMSSKERVLQKVRQYFYPKLRLIAFARWLSTKVIRPVRQPIQRLYSRQTAETCLEEGGFWIEEIISKKSHPRAPLAGAHVLIFVARKR